MALKILNLYCGIGGNRKLWNGDIEVTAVEINSEIAKIYQDFFPQDKVIVTDAHQFLLEHFKEFDFIWSSPPCPTHSRIMNLKMQQGIKPRFPNMQLYEEIIFLTHWFKGKWVVENVVSYYEPLIKPLRLGRHYIWSNFKIPEKEFKDIKITRNESSSLSCLASKRGISPEIIKVSGMDKRQVISNMVSYEMGKYILECSQLNTNLRATEELVSIPPNPKGIGYP
jgi:DNA (cytosine-5)-methyltransferase 1